MPVISVIISCYNQEGYIAECLDSVLAQTFKDYEVIVVNDGSTDNSLRVINPYIRKYHNFKLINQKNTGGCTARNNGIAQACGKYIYPLDGDDIISADMLEKSFNAIESGLGDIITTRVMLFGKTVEKELVLRETDKYNLAASNCLVNAALFRKTDFDAVRGYDQKFNKGLEDYDLWLNMVFRRGLKIYRIPEILFRYRIKNEKESRNLKQIKYAKALRCTLERKYPEMKLYKIGWKLRKVFRRIFHKKKP